MKTYVITGLALSSVLFGAASCSQQGQVVAVAASTIANVMKNSPTACNDLASLGANISAIANQIGNANPNNASIKSAVANAVTTSSVPADYCSQLSGAFKAEIDSGRLQGNTKVNIPVSVARKFHAF